MVQIKCSVHVLLMEFISWIIIYYFKPSAYVIIKGLILPVIKLQHGTCQICPLLPFVFNLVLDPSMSGFPNK